MYVVTHWYFIHDIL